MILKKLLSVFFPHKCTFCRKPIDYNNYRYICKDCEENLPYIQGSTCIKCSHPVEPTAMPVCYNCRKYKYSFSGSFTPLLYKDNVKKAIIGMKFYNKEAYCHSFSFLISQQVILKNFPSFDFITYVPLSKERFNKRGYNQSEIIATECSEILNVPIKSTLLRKDGSKQQSRLNLSERRKNVRNSFFPKDISLSGTALLIDDVYTTGSTADYCSSLLLKMGCSKVYIATVALREKLF